MTTFHSVVWWVVTSATTLAAAPLLSDETVLTASDARDGDHFGVSVEGVGDLDGDGYDDVIVGASAFHYYDGESSYDANPGAAYLYFGSRDGIDSTMEVKLTASDGKPGDTFGWSVSGAGDVNGDGHADVIVGAPFADESGEFSGVAYVYLGGPDGIRTDSEIKLTADGAEEGDQYGRSVSRAGDIDGDGYDDVIVGARGDDGEGTGESWTGAAYVYYGSADGIDPESEQRVAASDPDGHDYFGTVAGAGDVNGDGYDDVIIGAEENGNGAAYLYLGSEDGLDLDSEQKIQAPAVRGSDYFGSTVAPAGDVNGDGYDDVTITPEPFYEDSTHPGSAYLYFGSSGGLDLASETMLQAPDDPDYPGFRYGHDAAGAGDTNGDGYDDVVVSQMVYESDVGWTGTTYLYLGDADGIGTTAVVTVAASGGQEWGAGNLVVASAGDVNGDGATDVISGFANPQDDDAQGTASVYLGVCELGPACGDEGEGGDEDSGEGDGASKADAGDGGCACSQANPGRGLGALLLALIFPVLVARGRA